MGDRIAQPIFEKMKTPKIKEIDSLEGTDRGTRGYGSTGVDTAKANENAVEVLNSKDTQMKKRPRSERMQNGTNDDAHK